MKGRQMESTPLRRPLGRLIELNSGRHNGKHKSAKSNKSKAFPKKCNQNRSFASSWASGKIFIKCCLTILSVRYESKIRYTQQQQQQQQLSSQASEHPGSIKRPPKDTQIPRYGYLLLGCPAADTTPFIRRLPRLNVVNFFGLITCAAGRRRALWIEVPRKVAATSCIKLAMGSEEQAPAFGLAKNRNHIIIVVFVSRAASKASCGCCFPQADLHAPQLRSLLMLLCIYHALFKNI